MASLAYRQMVSGVMAAQARRAALSCDDDDYEAACKAERAARVRLCAMPEHKRAQAAWRARVEENRRRKAAVAVEAEGDVA